MQSHGFRVTPHYLGLETAWRAEFQHLKGGRTIGVNAEMDALQGMGHACGHNLIAISGVGVALALKAALQTHNVPGKVVLLGTPGPLLPSSFLLSHPLSLPPSPLAEEGGGGKIILLKRGGYKDMDACIMYGLASLFYLLAPSSISTGVIQQLVSFIPSVSGQQRLYKPSRLNTLVIGMVSVTIQTDIHYDPSLSLVHTQELHHGESTFLLSCTASP